MNREFHELQDGSAFVFHTIREKKDPFLVGCLQCWHVKRVILLTAIYIAFK